MLTSRVGRATQPDIQSCSITSGNCGNRAGQDLLSDCGLPCLQVPKLSQENTCLDMQSSDTRELPFVMCSR